MQVVYLGPKQVRYGVVLLVVMLLVSGLVFHWDSIARHLFGVKPGVTFEGRLVQGMLPDEMTRLVKAWAEKLNRNPMNACYFPETGRVIPATPGRVVNVAENIRMVYAAAPGSNLRVVVQEIPPKVSSDFFRPIYQGNPDLPRVALAINVAWGEEYLPEILKILAEEKVKATFFMVGTWVKMFPDQVKQLAGAGHEIANHGMYHGHPQQMSHAELKKLILDNEQLLTSLLGRKTAPLFAPPYGEVNPQIVSAAGELGFRTILWTVDSVDWKNPEPTGMAARILSKIDKGAIILFHPTAPTRSALRGIIKELRKKGLEPGTVSGVLGK